MRTAHPSHRGTIVLEDAKILRHSHLDGAQHVLRLEAPRCAALAVPGSFVHLRCDELLPMRRPLSIMRARPAEGWIDLLYKTIGTGTRMLAGRRPGDRLSLLGPIGRGFVPHPQYPRVLAIGGGVGIPPMIFLAEHLHEQPDAHWKPLVLMGSEIPFPFQPRPSRIMVPGIAPGVIASMSLLEDWGIPSRLASRQDLPGCHDGFVTELADTWLEALDPGRRAEVEIFACGPTPMLAAVARLARKFRLPCQVSLEEYMACGVGGCAGCAVRVESPAGVAMKRVCVDGPVFEATAVFPMEDPSHEPA